MLERLIEGLLWCKLAVLLLRYPFSDPLRDYLHRLFAQIDCYTK